MPGPNSGPLRGVRLEYIIPLPVERINSGELAKTTIKVRVLAKESVGEFFNLVPIYPDYGHFDQFKTLPDDATPPANDGYRYVKKAGFRYGSYTFFLKDGTQVTYPTRDGQGGTNTRVMKTIQMGLPSKGFSEEDSDYWRVTVGGIIEWVKGLGADQFNKIKGIQTPSGRRHFWTGDIPNQHPV